MSGAPDNQPSTTPGTTPANPAVPAQGSPTGAQPTPTDAANPPNPATSTTPAAQPPAPVEPVAPLDVSKLTLPTIEGYTFEEGVQKQFAEILNDPKLSPQERGQKLVDLQSGVAQQMADASAKLWADTQTQWQEQAKADPVIGGEKLEPALGQIAGLITRFGGDEASQTTLREVFTLTGAGNHPAMIKFLSAVAGELSEGAPVLGQPAQSGSSLASKMFPSMKG